MDPSNFSTAQEPLVCVSNINLKRTIHFFYITIMRSRDL